MAFLRDRSVFCIPKETLNHEQRLAISIICISTSTVGFIGAALQLRYLWQYRKRQRRRLSADPRIIFYLALSDLITCLGLFTLGILLIVFEDPMKVDNTFRAKHIVLYETIGSAVEIVALFGFLASVIWTFSFALDMCFQMYQINCPMVVYHILSWCIPLHFVVVVQVVNYVLWPRVCEGFYGMRSRLIISYLPVITVMVVNPILFLVTYRKVKQLLRSSGSFTVEDRQALSVCKRKFFWIVATFTICWFLTIISVLHHLITVKNRQTQVSKLHPLWFLEAFLNPLQGILNYFVYRHSFKVSSNDSRLGQGSLPRVPQMYDALEDCLRGKTKLPKHSVQNLGDSTSSGQTDEKSDFLLNSERTLNTSKEPKNKYVARLLGE